MTQINLQILTQWTPERKFDIDRMLVSGDSFSDATSQLSENIMPDPNLLIVEGTVSEATYQALLNDPNYGEGAILWSEELVEIYPE